MKKIIYDLGCHNGSNIPYYLLKADVVVAVDANPKLCEIIKVKFDKEIKQNRLVVENCIITTKKSNEKENFYILEELDVASTLLPDTKLYLEGKRLLKSDYKQISVQTRNIKDLIYAYGKPFYIKIDLEHYDHYILKEIFLSDIRPDYISSECHNMEVFNLMMKQVEYTHFKLLKGNLKFKENKIKNLQNIELDYEFPLHSAGPCCDDINGRWIEKDLFKQYFFLSGGCGWVDIHGMFSKNN